MTLSDVIQLIGAGFTKADIEAMEAQDQVENPDLAPKEEPKQAPEAQAPESAPQAPAADPALLEAIKTLTAAVQHSNVLNTAQPVNTTPDVQKEADDILTKFCNT